MPSERIQRRIDGFLDEADAASTTGDWLAVAEKACVILAVDEENEGAQAFLKVASANGGADGSSPPNVAITANAPAPPAPATPESFAGGRYYVHRFLGAGGKKKVHLAHDALLHRDVAFALIKTEGLAATELHALPATRIRRDHSTGR